MEIAKTPESAAAMILTVLLIISPLNICGNQQFVIINLCG